MRTEGRLYNVANLGQNLSFRDVQFSPARGASIWEGCPQLAAMDPAVAFGFFDDFLTMPLDDTTQNPSNAKWVSDTATGSITLPKVTGGVVDVATGNVDNNETYIQFGGAACDTAAPFLITSASNKPLWFEARVKSLQHADEAVFVGLAEEASAAANFLADNTGIPADKDFVGFRYKTDASAQWDVAWRKNGQAEQEIANVVANADDWHTFGFHFDGTNTVTFYINRVAHATVALANAATFPGAQNLAPIVAIKTGAAAARHVQVDYIKIVQIR